MNHKRDNGLEMEWPAALGASFIVVCIFLVALISVAGWPWAAKFLESTAPAWIQAIGSVAAIVAAIVIVQRQHSLELERKKADRKVEQLRRLRALRVVFFSAARTCESAARSVGRPHVYWPQEAAELREARARLISLDPMQIPLGKLVLLIEECATKLHACSKITEELQTPRAKNVEESVRTALMSSARECWLGLYETTNAEEKLIRDEEIESDQDVFDDFEESRRELDRIRASFVKSDASDKSAKSPSE